MTRADALNFVRQKQKYWDDAGPEFHETQAFCRILADALEAVERLETELEKWQSIGAEEELRRLAGTHEFRMLDRDDLINRADKIKARRESTDGTRA